MIVDPDFLSHYKTRQLIARIGEQAPVALIALWSHCQSRKAYIFDLDAKRLGGICMWMGNGQELLDQMVDVGFLDDLGNGSYEVHGWFERNKMIANRWGNKRAAKPASEPPPEKQPCFNPDSTLKQPSNSSETESYISHPIQSNPISSVEGESEGERKSKADEIKAALERIAATRGWNVDRLPAETKRLLFKHWREWGITVEELDLLIEHLNANDPDENYKQSLKSLVEDLPAQVDKARAWKTRKASAGRNANQISVTTDADFKRIQERRKQKTPEQQAAIDKILADDLAKKEGATA